MNIEWIHLYNLLSKANERACEAKYIYSLLDEALRRELGRVIERGPLQDERPADDELDQYEEVRVPEIDEIALENATQWHPGVMAGVPAGERLAPRRYVTRWRKILRRNPTDEREVFPDFRGSLQDLCFPESPLAKQFKTGPRVAMINRVNEWIDRKEAEYAAADAAKEAEKQYTESKKRPKQQKALADFLIVEDKQALIDRIGLVMKDAGPKNVAVVVLVLSAAGWLNVSDGKYAELCRAINDTYRIRHEPRNVVQYITGSRSGKMSNTDKNNMRVILQVE